MNDRWYQVLCYEHETAMRLYHILTTNDHYEAQLQRFDNGDYCIRFRKVEKRAPRIIGRTRSV